MSIVLGITTKLTSAYLAELFQFGYIVFIYTIIGDMFLFIILNCREQVTRWCKISWLAYTFTMSGAQGLSVWKDHSRTMRPLLNIWIQTLHLQTIILYTFSSVPWDLNLLPVSSTPQIVIGPETITFNHSTAFNEFAFAKPVLHVLDIRCLDDVFGIVQGLADFIKQSHTVLVIIRSNEVLCEPKMQRIFHHIRLRICYIRLIFMLYSRPDQVDVHQFNPFVAGFPMASERFNSTSGQALQTFLDQNTRSNFHRSPLHVKQTVDNVFTKNVSVSEFHTSYSLAGVHVWIAQLLADQLNASLHLHVPLVHLIILKKSAALADLITQPRTVRAILPSWHSYCNQITSYSDMTSELR